MASMRGREARLPGRASAGRGVPSHGRRVACRCRDPSRPSRKSGCLLAKGSERIGCDPIHRGAVPSGGSRARFRATAGTVSAPCGSDPDSVSTPPPTIESALEVMSADDLAADAAEGCRSSMSPFPDAELAHWRQGNSLSHAPLTSSRRRTAGRPGLSWGGAPGDARSNRNRRPVIVRPVRTAGRLRRGLLPGIGQCRNLPDAAASYAGERQSMGQLLLVRDRGVDLVSWRPAKTCRNSADSHEIRSPERGARRGAPPSRRRQAQALPMMALIRDISASTAKGLVIRAMPGSRKPSGVAAPSA